MTPPEAVAMTAAADPTTEAADMTAEGETITPLVGVTNAVVVTEMIIIAAPPLPLRGRLRQEALPPPDHAPEVQAPELHKPLTLGTLAKNARKANTQQTIIRIFIKPFST